MRRILKKLMPLALAILLPVLLPGCSEEQKLYGEAKEMAALSGKAHDPDKFPTAAAKLTEQERIRVSVYCTYPEWAGDIFTSLGEYKDSREQAQKAYYFAAAYNYEIYKDYPQKKQANPRSTYLDRAYDLFAKAGDYEDAPALAAGCTFIKIKEALALPRPAYRYAAVAKIFQSLDESANGKSARKKVAELLYGEVAPNLAADGWGLDGELFRLSGDSAAQRQSYINDVALLEIIKNDYPAPDDMREKMYRAAVQRADIPSFWEQMVTNHHRVNANAGSKASMLLQEEVFNYLGEYKDSATWARRIGEFSNTPVTSAPALDGESVKTGSAPQPRTVMVTYSTDGKVKDDFVEQQIVLDIKKKLCEKLKLATKGNIFFTKDATQASAFIHYDIAHEHFGTFNYSGGGVADYYHTKAVSEVRSADGKLLLRTGETIRVKKPHNSIGGDFKHINITMSVPVYDPLQTLQVLEEQFAALPAQEDK
ncbi:hypothetical protein LJC48_02455 [Desulfovibrio sp. OttesenSCG-928-C06]|nr:hypothetical protein [Desulfovibrio sp. OttesenSCG-928-C06]